MNKFLYALFSLHFLNDGVRTGIVALLPFVSKDLHLNFTEVGFLGSSQGVLTSILAFPAGFLAGRIGGYKLILLSLLIYSIGTLGIGVSPNIVLLIITFYIAAAGFGMFHVVGFSLVSRISEKTNIGKNLGNFTAVGDIGRILIPTIAIFAIPIFGWRITYISTAILCLLVFGLLQIFRQRSKQIILQEHKAKETHHEWIKQVFFILKQKKLLLILTAGVMDGLAGSPIYIFLPFLLLHKGISIAMLGVFTGTYFAGSLFGKSVLGRGADKFGNAKVFVIAELLMALCLILLAFSQQIILLLSLAFVLGLFTRGTTPVVTTLFSEVTHSNHYEKVFAISEAFLGITAALAPTTMGIIADKGGITFVFYIAALLAFLASIPIVLLIKSTPQIQ